MVYAQKTGINI